MHNKNNMNIKYLLFADYAIQDKNSDKYSLFGIFDNFTIPQGMKEISTNFVVFFRVLNSKGTTRVDIEVLDPDSKSIGKVSIPSEAPTQKDTLTVAAFIQDLYISKKGTYKLRIKINDTLVSDGDYAIEAI